MNAIWKKKWIKVSSVWNDVMVLIFGHLSQTDLFESFLGWAQISPWGSGFVQASAAGTRSRSDEGPAVCCLWIPSSDPGWESFCPSRHWRETVKEKSVWFTVIIITERWAATYQHANYTMTFRRVFLFLMSRLWSMPIIFHHDF